MINQHPPTISRRKSAKVGQGSSGSYTYFLLFLFLFLFRSLMISSELVINQVATKICACFSWSSSWFKSKHVMWEGGIIFHVCRILNINSFFLPTQLPFKKTKPNSTLKSQLSLSFRSTICPWKTSRHIYNLYSILVYNMVQNTEREWQK